MGEYKKILQLKMVVDTFWYILTTLLKRKITD